MKSEIKIENAKTSVTVSNLKCTEDDYPNCPRMHVSFDVSFESHEYSFSTNFSEMFYTQFDFKRGANQIIDECFPEKRLIVDKDKISLQIEPDSNDELTDIRMYFSLKKQIKTKLMILK